MNHFEDLRSMYLDQPNEISLETIALCNAACTFCPYPTIARKGEKMPDDLVDKVLEEISTFEHPFFFSPFKVNEPLLDRRLIEICKRAPESALFRIFTNGAALTQRWIDDIASLDRVYHLWISLNSHIPDEYEALMKMPFERTAKRLDNLHGQEFPHQVVLSTVGYPNEDFRRYCFDRWPKFESLAIEKSGWLGFTDAQKDEIPDIPCARWFELSITSTGIVSLCCMDGEAQFPIGDIREQSLLDIYNAPHWRERRAQLLSRKEVYPCSTCTY